MNLIPLALYAAALFGFARAGWADWVKHRDDEDPGERRIIIAVALILVAFFTVVGVLLGVFFPW